MGLMYWQLNDIWEGATWSTIEYGLKWKLSHYYVKDMYSSIYLLMRLTPYLPSPKNNNAQITFYLFNDLNSPVRNEISCSVYSFDSFIPRLSFNFDVMINSSSSQLINTTSFKWLTEEGNCSLSSECLMRCSLTSNGELSNQIKTLWFSRPREIQMFNPNLRIISIEQKSSFEIDLTIQCSKPALFIWIDTSNQLNGYFSLNGFHLFQPQIQIRFTSWINLTHFHQNDFTIVSLYDVTQP